MKLFAQRELPVVAFLALATIAIEALLPVAALAIFIFTLIRTVANGRPTTPTPVDWTVIPLLLFIPLNIAIAIWRPETLTSSFRLIIGIGLFYALINDQNRWFSPGVLMLMLALIGAGLASAGLLLTERTTTLIPTVIPTLSITTINPNIIAGALAILAPFCLAGLIFAWGETVWFERAWLAACFIIMIGVLVLSYSRGGLLGAAVGCLTALIFRWRISVFGLPSIPIIFYWLITQVDPTNSITTLENRREIWSRALYMLQDFPTTGLPGIGAFGKIADSSYPFFLSEVGSIPHAHNIWLQVAVDLGIVGLILWWATVLITLTTAYHLSKTAGLDHGINRAIGVATFAATAALLTHGIIDAPLWDTRVALFVWIIWGINIRTFLQSSQ